MKTKNLKTKIIALSMSVITACSVGMMAVTPASAASIHTGDSDFDAIYNSYYQGGMGIIREFVPGGQAITGIIDSLVGSFTDQGPSLSDIREDLSDFRKDVSRQFDEIKEELKNIQEQLISSETAIRDDIEKQAHLIEQQVVAQTVIAGKGAGFDDLMTALKETDRQINDISNDNTLSDNEKAVQIAMLLGRNDKWNSKDNLYFSYMSFLNTLTSSTFCATGDHDIFYYIYQSNIPYSAFTWDAKQLSKPYIERLMQLGVYTYSITAECLEAAHRVASFTKEDVANLSEDEVYHYHEVKSLKSIVDNTFVALNKKVFDTSDPNSIAAHLKSFNDINDRIFIKNGTVNIPLNASIAIDSKHLHGDEYGVFNYIYPEGGKTILNHLKSSSPLSFDDINYLASYVKLFYPGKSMADYLMMVGFDNENLRNVHWRKHQLYLMTDNAYTEYSGDSVKLVYSGIDVHNSLVENQHVTSSVSIGEYGHLGTDYVMFFIADKS